MVQGTPDQGRRRPQRRKAILAGQGDEELGLQNANAIYQDSTQPPPSHSARESKQPKQPDTQNESKATSAFNQATFEEPGSRIWLPYIERAEKHDHDLVKTWRDDMDAILIFAALFSASVTAFVIESYQSLQKDPGDITNALLLQISQQLANGTGQPTSQLANSFQPTSSDLAVNICWFLSLGFSLACSLGAILVRQWAWHYLRVPGSLPSIAERARMRQYLFEGIQRWKLEFVVDMIPALMHISLFLFLVGLLIFLHTINEEVALFMLFLCTLGIVTYTFLTIAPTIFPRCPYSTPFTRLLVPTLQCICRSTVMVLTSLIVWSSWFFIFISTPYWRFQKSEWFPLDPPASILHNIAQQSKKHPGLWFGWSWRPAWATEDDDVSVGTFQFVHYVRKALWLPRFLAIERRRNFRAGPGKETAARDVRALRWTIVTSSGHARAILATILQAISDYEPSDLFLTQQHLLSGGAITRVNSLLVSCINHLNGKLKEKTNDTVLSSLTAILWMSRLSKPATSNEPQGLMIHGLLPPSCNYRETQNSLSTWRMLGADKSTAFTARCALSILHLRQFFQLTTIYQAEDSAQSFLACQSRMTLQHLREACELSKVSLRLLDDWTPETTYQAQLRQTIIQEWAEKMFILLFPNFEADSSSDGGLEFNTSPLVISAIHDASTYLRHHPELDREVQSAFFGFIYGAVNAKLRDVDGSFKYQNIYGQVLFNLEEGSLDPSTSLTCDKLHSDMFKRIEIIGQTQPHVQQLEFNPQSVFVDFADYCRILEEFSRDSKDIRFSHYAESRAIRSAISSRRVPTEAGTPTVDPKPVIVTETHIEVVKDVLFYSNSQELRDLLHKTAKMFEYSERLKDTAKFTVAPNMVTSMAGVEELEGITENLESHKPTNETGETIVEVPSNLKLKHVV